MSVPTNRRFAQTDSIFIRACENAGIPATGRQAGKYRRRVGAAFGARPTATDLSTLTVAKLKVALDQSGIEYKSKDRKATLVALLRGE